MVKNRFAWLLVVLSALVAFGPAADGKEIHVPAAISPEARSALEHLGAGFLEIELPPPGDVAAWREIQAAFEKDNDRWLGVYTEKYGCRTEGKTIGGVPVFEVLPPDYRPGEKLLVYLHGGGYSLLSPCSNLSLSFPFAAESGLKIVAVDYTLAPHADWRQISDEAVAVITGLYAAGYAPENIGVYGDSAGGAMAAGVLLKMRDAGLPLPGAVALISPWADITKTGDSYFTLEADDPFIVYNAAVRNAADAYAAPADQKHPVVSPVYGDYAKGFVPTLIQGGTKETFLSNFVRLYQAMDQAGICVTLDLYEGMWHDFIAYDELPEAKIARGKIVRFFKTHLGVKR